jgi:serine/threonine protein kinase
MLIRLLILTHFTQLHIALHLHHASLLCTTTHRDENLYFVFEYMAGGSLYELMKRCIAAAAAAAASTSIDQTNENSNKEAQLLLSADKIRIYTQQILKGLSYIHNQGYIHRDIKPENILLHGNGSVCKVADFGLARPFGSDVVDDNSHRLTYYVSTRWYRAPEVILRCPSYGTPIDLFATGLVFAELHSLRPLLPGTSEIDQLSKMMTLLGSPSETLWEEGAYRMKQLNFSLVSTNSDTSTMQDEVRERTNIDRVELAIRCALSEFTSPMAITLIRQLVAWNPSSRLSANDALQHEYFQSTTDSKHANIGARSEKFKERFLSKCTGRHNIKENPFDIEQPHHPYRHNLEENVVERRGDDDDLRNRCFQPFADQSNDNTAVLHEDEDFQFHLEQDCDRQSKPCNIEPRQHHSFRHNVGEITVEERADDALQHECFQSNAFRRNARIVRTESKDRVTIECLGSRIQQFRDENSIPERRTPLRNQFRHNVGEFDFEQRKSATRMNNHPNPPLASTMIVQRDNEFCNYLNAISNATHCEGPVPNSRNLADHSFGNSLHPTIPERSNSGTKRIPSHQGLIGLSTSCEMQRSTQISRSSQLPSSMNTGMPSTIRSNRFGSSGNKYSLHSRGRTALAEKPRWLLSNQNMGRGAMEVCISRPVDPMVVENEPTKDWTVRQEEDRSFRENSIRENPFTSF